VGTAFVLFARLFSQFEKSVNYMQKAYGSQEPERCPASRAHALYRDKKATSGLAMLASCF
jgi:hypothetical protein